MEDLSVSREISKEVHNQTFMLALELESKWFVAFSWKSQLDAEVKLGGIASDGAEHSIDLHK